MKINYYLADNWGCGYYRMIQPAKEIIKHKPEWQINVTGMMKPEELVTDVMVLQRAFDNNVYTNMLYAHNSGTKIMYDIDDWLLGVHHTNPAYTLSNNPIVQANMKIFWQDVDMISVSTEYLKKLMSEYNSNIKVYPNCIDFDIWDKIYETREYDDYVIIGWAGSPSHYADISQVIDVLAQVLRENHQVKLKVVGWDFTKTPKFKGLESQIIFESHGIPVNFGYKLTDFDIGIAPLMYSDFNRAKSNIKFLEYSALEIPTIATDIEPYQCIEHGKTGYLIKDNDQQEWYKTLTYLVYNHLIRREVGKEARKYVKANFNIKKNVQGRINDLENLIKQ